MDDEPGLQLPRRPEAPGRAPLPVLGLVAPLVLAAVLYAATGSPLTLLFALLGPLLAVTAAADGRIWSRRRLRHERAAHAAALDSLERTVAARAAAARADLESRHPSPAILVQDPASWRARPPRGPLVLGRADLVRAPLVRGDPADARERAIAEASRIVPGAPFTVPAGCSVAVSGPPLLATAFARAVGVARARAEGIAATAAVVADLHLAGHDVAVRVDGAGRAVVVHAAAAAEGTEGRVFTPAFVTATAFERVVAVDAPPPPLGPMLESARAAGALDAVFGVDDAGEPVGLDLAVDGPHAVVAGTTGSGKSALLSAWLLAMTAARPPGEVALLLVDCKGGAAFDPLAALPHVAGVVTDLDHDGVDRVVSGLTAELRRRERLLRAVGAADVSRTGLARLVVVVDEYRALVERAPHLAAVLADVAARGRSLGVHLIVCTQRATGVVREELLANCGLRIGLRMRDAGDSTALLGRPDAARLRSTGTAVVLADGDLLRLRVADADAASIAAGAALVAARWAGTVCEVPWFPPLPERLPLSALTASGPGVVLGLLDRPDEQAQPPLVWDPVADPSLVVVGAAATGRTNTLELVAAALGAPVVAGDAAAFWDAVHSDDPAVIVDDLEALLDALGPAHAVAALERLTARLRARSGSTVLALCGPGAWSGLPVRSVLHIADRRLLLGLDPDDHVSVGGARALASGRGRVVPGRGEWSGVRAQIALSPVAAPRAISTTPSFHAGDAALLVSPGPAARRQQLRRARIPVADVAGADGVWVGAPGEWQADWSRLSRLQATTPLLLDRLPPADVRALGIAGLPPPLIHPDDVVLVPPGGAPRRVRLREP